MGATTEQWIRDAADEIYRQTQGVISRGYIEILIKSHAPSDDTKCSNCGHDTNDVMTECSQWGHSVPKSLRFDQASEAAAQPTIIGVDLASGPDMTVFTCMECGSSETSCKHYSAEIEHNDH